MYEHFARRKLETPLPLVLVSYSVVAFLAVLKGTMWSSSNLAFTFCLLLPILLCFLEFRLSLLFIFSILLCFDAFRNTYFFPYSTTHLGPQSDAEKISALVKNATGPVLLDRKQEFLIRHEKEVHDDLGVMNEFKWAGNHMPRKRIEADILSGKYEIILSLRENLGGTGMDNVVSYLGRNYSKSENSIFRTVYISKNRQLPK